MTQIDNRPAKHRCDAARPEKTGSALIGLVVAILIFSVLAAAIVPMVGSTGQQVAISNMAARAYLLAESGFRYAASQYLHAGDLDKDKNDLLEELDGNYTLSGDNGGFNLDIYSYFYAIVGDTSGAPSQVKAHCPGSLPDDITIANGLGLRIGDEDYTITAATPVAGEEDDNMTLSLTPALSFYPSHTRVLPMADAVSVETYTEGAQTRYSIVYENDDARMFPLRNGRIKVDANDRYYTYRFNDRPANRLVDIRDPENPYLPITSLSLSPGTKILLMPHVRLQSTGIFGSGLMAARRSVTYHAPLPLSQAGTEQINVTERFDTKQDWTDTSGTVTAIGDVGGNNALKVEDTAVSGTDEGSLTAYAPQTIAAETLFNANRRASRGYLSYNTQVKIGFEATPVVNFYPRTPIPAHVAAGLNFRMGDLPETGATIFNVNTYGVSFLRGDDSVLDGIPDELVPVQNQRSIVLWQQTGNGSSRNWIAYKSIPVIFPLPLEDFEMADGWSKSPDNVNNLWNRSSRNAHSGTQAWYFGQESFPGVFNYDRASRTSGALQSPEISLPADYPATTLSFWSWHATESADPGRDVKQVRISVDGGAFEEIFRINRDPDEQYWYRETVDLSEYAGRSIRLQFFFDTIDRFDNGFEGWTIDDVQVMCEWPVQNAALGIRLQEAMAVRFYDGYPEIKAGDRIYGNNRYTVGTVMAPPLLTGGDWTDGDRAEGTLLLVRTSVATTAAAFDAAANEVLTVIGGTGRAKVLSDYDDTNDRKANFIETFYATETGGGNKSGNGNPLDSHTEAYPRLGASDDLIWFPHVDGDGNWTDQDGNWTDAEDVFRLIQWDDINDGEVSGLKSIDFTTRDQGRVQNAIVQSHHSDLQSPAYPGIVSQTELGLHSMGTGARNVYFDDFGIQIEISETDIVPAPLQQ